MSSNIKKWSQNPGGPKVDKNGEKWPAKMTCKNGEPGFLNLHHRIAITLTFAKCLVAIEPVGKKLLAYQKIILPP